jgi:serine/threonine protein kinase
MPPSECIHPDTLFALTQGILDDSSASAALMHVDQCQSCALQLEGVERIDPLFTALRTTVAGIADPTAVDDFTNRVGQRILKQLQENEATRTDRISIGSLIADRYLVLAVLGDGGMGVVYLAEDKTLTRQVALKFPKHLHELNLSRLQKEAAALANLEHDNICPIYDANQHDKRPFLVLKLIHGKTLRELLQKGPIDTSKVIEIAIAISKALASAHQRGIVHRDLKPGNVMLDDHGKIWLMDFGLAKNIFESNDATGTGMILGTPGYMAPEQQDRSLGVIGPHTDIYSFGVLMREMLDASRTANTTRNSKNLTDTLVSRLDEICKNAAQRDPKNRIPSARALVSTLENAQAISTKSTSKFGSISLFVSVVATFACMTVGFLVWQNGLSASKPDANESLTSWPSLSGTKQDSPRDNRIGREQPRKFISEQEVLSIVENDIRSISEVDRPYQRYLSLGNIWNTPADNEALQSTRQAVATLLSRLSNTAPTDSPKTIGDQRVVLRIDLRDHGWKSIAHWYEMLKMYPYGMDAPGDAGRFIQRELDTEIPYVRADWFVVYASRPPLSEKLRSQRVASSEVDIQAELQSQPVTSVIDRYSSPLALPAIAAELGLPENPETAKAAGLKCSALDLNKFASTNQTLIRIGIDKLQSVDTIPRMQWELLFQRAAREVGAGVPRNAY